MRVLIVASTALHREGLAAALERHQHIRDVECAATMDDAVARAERWRPELAVLELPETLRLAVARAIVRVSPATRLVALVETTEEVDVVVNAGAGIMGWQSLDGSTQELAQLLERVARGELACSAVAAGRLARQVTSLTNGSGASSGRSLPAPERLTPREREVLDMLERGLSNKEIARALAITIPTVKNHVHSVLEKLGVGTRGAAVAAVWRRVSAPPAASADVADTVMPSLPAPVRDVSDAPAYTPRVSGQEAGYRPPDGAEVRATR